MTTSYPKGVKYSGFWQGDERRGASVSYSLLPVVYSIWHEYTSIFSYPVTFRRPYNDTYMPALIPACGFNADNIGWFVAGGVLIDGFDSLTNTGFTGYCTVRYPYFVIDPEIPLYERILYEGDVVFNWRVDSEEDVGYNQHGVEIQYQEGGLP